MQLKIKKEIQNETKTKCIRRLACRGRDNRGNPVRVIAFWMITHGDIAKRMLSDMFQQGGGNG